MITAPARAACNAPNAAAGTMFYNSSENVPQYCDDTNWIAMAPLGGFDVDAVTFDGANDYLTQNSQINGIENTKKATISVWLQPAALSATMYIFNTFSDQFQLRFNDSIGDVLQVAAENSSDTNIIDKRCSQVPVAGQWAHYLISFDLANPASFSCYVNDVSGSSGALFTNDVIDFSPVNSFFAGSYFSDGSLKYNGDIADLWIDFGTYIDLSVEENRRKFITAHGKPAFLGKSGHLPTGSAPDIFLSGDATAFHNNKGTGGGFIVNGALTDAADSPAGAADGDFTSGLVGHWKLDETSGQAITDYGSGGNDGIWEDDENNDVTEEKVDGFHGTALRFEGDNRIDTTYQPGATGSAAIWFRPLVDMDASDPDTRLLTAATGGGRNPIFAKDWAKGSGISDCGGGDDGSIDFTITPFGGSYSNICTTTTSWTAGKWYHLVATWNGTTQNIYVNGVLERSMAQSHTGGWGTIQIGSSSVGATADIDDVRLYSRALTAEDVKALYLNTAKYCAEPDGVPGQLYYNPDTHTPMYCDDDHWVAMNKGRPPEPTGCPNIGDPCSDGTIYAGLSPANGARMFTTAADAGTYAWGGSGVEENGDNNSVAPELLDDGLANTDWLVNDSTVSHPAAEVCRAIGPDWYLPALNELNVLYTNRGAIGGFNGPEYYWSSTEHEPNSAKRMRFDSPSLTYTNYKYRSDHYVRCVRRAAISGLAGGDPSLVAYWPLNENGGTIAHDVAGDNDGTASGGVTFSSSGGQIGGAATFDGSDSELDAGSDSSIDDLAAMSLSVWINPNSVGEDTAGLIAAKATATGGSIPTDGWLLRMTSTNQVKFSVNYDVSNLSRAVPNASVPNGSWTHVVVTWNGGATAADDIKIYLNGTESASAADDGSSSRVSDAAASLFIGGSPGTDRNFDGLIDDLRIYSRVLSGAEIQAIYDAGATGLAAQDCTSPNAAEGVMLYNTDVNAVQYCDGANWVRLGKP